jgi:undecaprenyl-diphosphatase
MSVLEALILGLVEGITEYLPISSTGHLIIAATLLGLGGADTHKALDDFLIVIQGGAIAAVAGLYRGSIRRMAAGLAGREEAGRRLLVHLVVAFLPAAVLGPLLKDLIQERLFRAVPVIAALVAGGVLMVLLRRYQPKRPVELEGLTWRRALLIGLAQCVAMWPGTSRSMATIVAGMLCGLRPRAAAEFSFLLGLPTLGGACAYASVSLLRDGPMEALARLGGPVPVTAGFAAATISAAVAVRWLVAYLSRRGVGAFGWYRIALGGLLLVLVLRGALTIAPG